MKFLGAVLLLLFTFDAVVKAQIMNPKAEIVSSSEKIVRSAPFSAEAISESVQILFDGNRITQSMKTRLYRDGEGRFRRDELPKPVGIGSFVDVPQMIFILDPVLNVKFYLNPESKTARQSALKKVDVKKPPRPVKPEFQKPKNEQEIARVEQEIARAEQDLKRLESELEKRKQAAGYQETEKDRSEIARRKKMIEVRRSKLKWLKQQNKSQNQRDELVDKVNQSLQIADKNKTVSQSSSSESSNSSSSSVSENEKPAKEASQAAAVKKATKAVPSKNAANPNEPNNPALPVFPKGEVKNESLGTRKIEGVEAEGVRLTTTVAAGSIGNERPIEIVYERWYSKELQLIVLSKYSDPRFGEQTYRVINIKRDEPDAALFTLPGDYKIVNKPETPIKFPGKKPFN
jgi:hypothetical protein